MDINTAKIGLIYTSNSDCQVKLFIIERSNNIHHLLSLSPRFYLYDMGPDLDTVNLGKGLGPVLADDEPSACFTFLLEL